MDNNKPYTPESGGFLKGFGITEEKWANITEENLVGTADECLEHICNNPEMPNNIRYMLLLEMGTRIALGSLEDMIKKHQEYVEQNANTESSGEQSSKV